MTVPELVRLAGCLLNTRGCEPLPARFRALFELRALGSDAAVDVIGRAFVDPSALLKHELAYVLGQMQNAHALPVLNSVLADLSQDAMVRHEAAEALGAIGRAESVAVLQDYLGDGEVAVRETCVIAIERIQRGEAPVERAAIKRETGEIAFDSVDPAPALKGTKDTAQLGEQLMDTALSLYDRYKAMFALRNRATEASVLELCRGFGDCSALFRHEIAYVLGQLQHPASIPALARQLAMAGEAAMVRHECAEALGSIATPACLVILERFLDDPEQVVRESCVVALDMYEYENSAQLE